MFGTDVESLVAKQTIAIPLREEDNDFALIHDMWIACGNGLLPVFFGSLPSPGEVNLEREVSLSLPIENATATKNSLRKFMSDFRINPDAALTRLVEELENQASIPDALGNTRPVRLMLLKFKVGPNDVIHPALVL